MSEDAARDVKEQLNRIERCLIGDEKMGQRGLVQRMDNHAARIKALERAGVYLSGAAGLLVVLWAIYTQWPRK